MATGPISLDLHIRNEADAFAALEQALAGSITNQAVSLHFEQWPVLSVRYEGDGYDSTVTPDIAEAIIELQHALNRAYARHVLLSGSARAIPKEVKRGLQVKAKVQPGSSLINIDLGEFGTALINGLAGRMTSEHQLIAVLGIALTAGAVVAWKGYLKHKSEDKLLDHQTKLQLGMSQEETRRAQILADAMTRQPALQHTSSDFDDARREFVRAGTNANTTTIQGLQMKADDAKQIASAPRTASEEVQLNGHYTIQRLDWQHEGECRILLSSTDNPSLSFVASLIFTMGVPEEQKKKLQQAEWDRLRLFLAINATKLRGEVTSARIISVDWPDPASPPDAA